MPHTHRVDVDVKEFCGWDELRAIVDRAEGEELRALIAALFLTGGRISEVLALRRENFDLSREDVILVKGMSVSKRFRKVGQQEVDGRVKWITEKVAEERTFPIMRNEPLVPVLQEWLERLTDREELLFHMSRVKAFYKVRGLRQDLYPHWFRAQRASQLASEYGFDLHDLMDYFHWKDIKMALRYSRMGWQGLARKMQGTPLVNAPSMQP